MKILIVSQYFWPESFRINDLCTQLVKRGHEVTVLTGWPNYPSGRIFPEFKEDPSSFQNFAGSEVIRVPIIPRGKGGVQLAANYLSYVVFASIWGVWKLRKHSFDVIFVYEPSPITVCLPAILLKAVKNAPIVFWVQDLWPETLESVGVVRSKPVLRLIGHLVSYIYNRCDLILGQSQAFLSIIAKYCQDKTKIKYFPNWAEDIFKEASDSKALEIVPFKDEFKVLFAGNVGAAQDFPSILSAAELIKKEKAKIRFFAVGDGRMFKWVAQEIRRRGLNDYVFLLGWHPLESMPNFYASADVLLVALRESPVFSRTIPAKMQSYIAAGKPVVTMLSGEGSRLVSESACGLVAEAGNYKDLAQNIIKMSQMTDAELQTFSCNARALAENEFNRERLINQLEEWFTEIIQNKAGSGP